MLIYILLKKKIYKMKWQKKDLILNREKLTRKGVAKFHESVTGGATGEPLHFRTVGFSPKDVKLAPFFEVHFQRYTIYWKMITPANR